MKHIKIDAINIKIMTNRYILLLFRFFVNNQFL
jgi:hypothetical protein